MCDACGSLAWDCIAASGRGTLHSFTVIHYPQFPGYDFPIVAALVDLEEGERIFARKGADGIGQLDQILLTEIRDLLSKR